MHGVRFTELGIIQFSKFYVAEDGNLYFDSYLPELVIGVGTFWRRGKTGLLPVVEFITI